MADPAPDKDPRQAAEELDEESERQGRRIGEAEEPAFTTRRERLHEKEDPEAEHEGKRTSQDYA
ncbi:hypothetical protein AB0910_04905 [Streptomyces sp. NPDC047002]|uniref:hypothetical protein n=1 Tax=Streptomyces sp. NPDC047002 TaxID=3155475 RepID=UPI003452AAAA